MIKAILTDIEGTTSSISFVKEVLFPYAAQKLPDYVRANCNHTDVQAQLRATAKESGIAETDTEALIAQLLQWIREDKKVTPLKNLQGMIWQYGYEQGAYRAHVYADAVEKLKEWHVQGLKLYVYSSGSIHAQKLFFKYSEAGDLMPLFSDYFDTTSGSKQDTQSYRNIAVAIRLPANEVLFLSDIEGEINAARQAGMQTAWVQREGEKTVSTPHKVVTSFEDIHP